MITTQSPSFDSLETNIETLTRKMMTHATEVMKQVTQHIASVTVAATQPPEQQPGEPYVSLETLGIIATLWAGIVTADLAPYLTSLYIDAAFDLVTNATTGGAAAKRDTTGIDRTELLNHTLAADYLATANNRMVAFGDDLWQAAKIELLAGFLAGESIPELKARLQQVPQITEKRARVVARTEVVAASNAGSLAMVEIAGFTGKKIWSATPDLRTRESHRQADTDYAEGIPIGDRFIIGPSNAPLLFPGDPLGPPEETIQCRCVLLYRLDDEPLTAATEGGPMADPMPDPLPPPQCEWIGVMAVEGTPTGDGRMFTEGALTWADLPLPLLWQKETGDGHDNSVIAGNVTTIVRQGTMIIGRGSFDMQGDDGQQAYRLVRDGYLSGVSIDADNATAADIEYTYDTGPDGEPMVSMQKVSKARIRGLTLCAIPAFVEAKIMAIPAGQPDQNQADQSPYGDAFLAAGTPVHHTGIDTGSWDSGAQEKQLPSPVPFADAKHMYAWVDYTAAENGAVPKTACKLPHHVVNDGKPGPANLEACSAGIAALNGGRGGVDIPEAQVKAAYNHLAAHLKDGKRTPPPLRASGEPITAAAYTLVIPDLPPKWWFDEPNDAEIHGAFTVTDEGRVYGLIAPANVNHRSYAQAVTVPRGNVSYKRFLKGETITATGERVVTGALTMDCGHATHDMSTQTSIDHYDNACSVVAHVNCGENRHGVWFAGALVHGITANQISRMMACVLSGDWRGHPTKSGWREFAGALLVPVPGFPMARTAPSASVRVEEGLLVASAVPVQYQETIQTCGCPTVDDYKEQVKKIRESVLIHQMNALKEKINGRRQ